MIRRLLIALVLVGMSAQAHASSNGILTQGLSSSTSSSITLTTTGSSGAAVLSGSNLNIPVYSGAGEVTNGDSALNITSTTNMAATSAVFSAARTWTLPGASTVAAGQRVCVSDQVGAVSTSFPLTIAASGTDTINPESVTSISLNSAYEGVCLTSNGLSAWQVDRQPAYTQYGIGMSQDSYNCTPQNTSHLRVSLARVQTGQGNATWVFIGDSTMFGSWGGAGGIDTGNLVPTSMPTRVAQLLNPFVSANSNNFLGGGNSASENRISNDGRLTFGSGWSFLTGSSGALIGGNIFQQTTQNTGSSMSFTPTISVDTFKVWYVTSPSAATFSINIDGGAATNINATGSNGFGSHTITAGSAGTHTLNIQYVSGATENVFIAGIQTWNSGVSTINIVNAGWPGSTTANNINNSFAYNAFNSIPLLSQDVTFVELGLNDLSQSVSAATYKSNMQTLITQASTTGGDVILIPPNVNNLYSTVTWQSFVEANRQLATSNNLCMVDIAARWQNWTLANALGFMSSGSGGTQHPGILGYYDEAQTIFNVAGHP